MTKKILLILSAFTFMWQTQALADYVKGDGSLDFTCHDKNIESKPYNIFDFVLKYDDSTGKSGFDIISDENLASGNGDVIYEITATQFPFYGAEILPQKQVIPGCKEAPLMITMSEAQNKFEVYFECRADGDAGYGEIQIDFTTGKMEGEISFPEGQYQLAQPIEDSTTYQIECDYKQDTTQPMS